eukprot:2412009-Pleurochrysis_carterae.AAC.1
MDSATAATVVTRNGMEWTQKARASMSCTAHAKWCQAVLTAKADGPTGTSTSFDWLHLDIACIFASRRKRNCCFEGSDFVNHAR